MKPPYAASARAGELHQQLTIADLHADSLLWGRLLRRATTDRWTFAAGRGECRLAGVFIAAPRGLDIEHNDDKSDGIRLLAIVGRWPIETWNRLNGALYIRRGDCMGWYRPPEEGSL